MNPHIQVVKDNIEISKLVNVVSLTDDSQAFMPCMIEKKVTNFIALVPKQTNKIANDYIYPVQELDLVNLAHQELKVNLSLIWFDLRNPINQKPVVFNKLKYPCLTWLPVDYTLNLEAIAVLKMHDALIQKGLMIATLTTQTVNLIEPWLENHSLTRWNYGPYSICLIAKQKVKAANNTSTLKSNHALAEFSTLLSMYTLPTTNKALDIQPITKEISWRRNPKVRTGPESLYMASNKYMRIRFKSQEKALAWAVSMHESFTKTRLKCDWYLTSKYIEDTLNIQQYIKSPVKDYWSKLQLTCDLDKASSVRLINLLKYEAIATLPFPMSRSQENIFWTKTTGDTLTAPDGTRFKITYVRYIAENQPPVFTIEEI